MSRNKLAKIKSGTFRMIEKLSKPTYEVERAKKRRETKCYQYSKRIVLVKMQVQLGGELKLKTEGGVVL